MSPLKIFDTLAGQKKFVPLVPGKVKFYVCGPTVYDNSHIGHARCFLTFDVMQRYLRFLGYDVTYVRNITDVDDKIINRAKESAVSPEYVARKFTYAYWKDMSDINARIPDVEPRCTEFIPQMLSFIAALIEKRHAYASGGDVYFDVASFKDYGKLKKQSLEDMVVGAREQVRSQEDLQDVKRNPMDFALWKSAAKDEMGWESPWGWGRPGWHLECSAMNKHVLGETIDIHGGAEDLVFPHHENEIAQSEALHGKPFSRYWVHNAFLNINAEKMSKSLGNFKTIQDVLKTYSADDIRMLMMQSHYRSPLDFTGESMDSAKAGTQRLLRAAKLCGEAGSEADSKADFDTDSELKTFHQDFVEAMDNDFNTPVAISVLFALADAAFTSTDDAKARRYAAALKHYANVLGFTLQDTTRIIDSGTAGGVLDLVLQLREKARANKDYASSDLIRDHLQKLGIKIMDIKGGGATWERI